MSSWSSSFNLFAPLTVSFYEDCDYGGKVLNLKPGEYNYNQLDPVGNDNISSVKVAAGLKVILFENGDFQGRSITLTENTPCLVNQNFNDLTSSIKIMINQPQSAVQSAVKVVAQPIPQAPQQAAPQAANTVLFYEDCDYGGKVLKLTPGEYNYNQLDPVGNDNISSVKVPPGVTVILFEDGGFQGKSITLTQDAPCLIDQNFNDLTSSIKIIVNPTQPVPQAASQPAPKPLQQDSLNNFSMVGGPNDYCRGPNGSTDTSQQFDNQSTINDCAKVALNKGMTGFDYMDNGNCLGWNFPDSTSYQPQSGNSSNKGCWVKKDILNKVEIKKPAATVIPHVPVPVPVGNWTEYVKDFINGKERVNYTIGNSGGGTKDPAVGCSKQFSTSYRCGNGAIKTINISPDANGQTITFDCFSENQKCRGFRLSLTDDGNMVLTNATDPTGTILWQSSTNQTGLPIEKYRAVNSKYKRNYIQSGETLSAGEFIGSPSGNCYLIMDNKTDGSASLELRYESFNCSGNMIDNSFGNDSDTVSIYTIKKENPTNLGKLGYVDDNGTIHQYPNELLQRNDKFFNIGRYSNIGNDIQIINNTNKMNCENICKSKPDCAGYVFNNSNNECQIKNSNIFPKSSRMVDNSSELYIRGSDVLNSTSCSKVVNNIDTSIWELSNIGDKMSMDTLCNLGAFTQEDRKDLEASNDNMLSTVNDLYNKIMGETKTLTQINGDLEKNRGAIASLNKTHDNVKKSIIPKKNESLQFIAMKEDSKTQLISENFNYMLWSILAISIIGYVVKSNRD